IYIGGGTPSLLPPQDIAALMEDLLAGQAGEIPEITIEANPESVDENKLAVWLKAGLNRLSLGVQSFDDALLQAMGRPHSSAQATKALQSAKAAGFKNISIDLIYGLPGQTLEGWHKDLKQALDMPIEHISLYGLSLSEDSLWGRAAKAGQLTLPDDYASADMLQAAMDTLPAAGFAQYEISNFARAGFESRHNTAYWQRENYLGLGVAAASCHQELRWFNERDITAYTDSLAAGKLPQIEKESLSIEEILGEALFLNLRLKKGLNLEDFAKRYGTPAERYYKKPLSRLQRQGLVEIKDGYLKLTKRGILLGNEVFMQFV
ncbi:MAG: radical SAM family heme chaperone HemW, partial [Clostridiales bacterium]|nr:radical SAM family heme chaperone HemW [Clostridiales bacterium]